LITR